MIDNPLNQVTENELEQGYRNRIATVDQQGKRVWIYPKRVIGRFYKARTYASYVLLLILFSGPFIKINGQPILMLNILERKFVILGKAFWPQDFHLFALAALTGIISIVLFTAVYGRLFCGWACPQTIFLEMVFRKIEYFIDGDPAKQRRLDKQPWNGEKIFKRLIKHIIYYSIAFVIGNTFLAYIIGIDALLELITSPPSEHLTGFTAMVIFSFMFYWVFAYFREQACVLVCPYGRFQSVLLDKDSIVVSYDFKRGEPRQRYNKKETRENAGDCIDCALCVQVCPTGIDIRNGTQLECVNCTNCIDACDSIMDRVGTPRGLIRYDSYNGIATGNKIKITPRAIGYTTVLVILISVLTFLLVNRADVETTILRTPGVLFQITENQDVSNLYNYKVVNKTYNETPIEFRLLAPTGGTIKMVGQNATVKADDLTEGAFFVEIPHKAVFSANMMIQIGVYSNNDLLEKVTTNFNGPLPPR